MNLLVTAEQLRQRRNQVEQSGSLKALFDSLARDLDDVIDRAPVIPPEKAKLTRAGGRCPRDGVLLEFDPFSPHVHRCPVCGQKFSGDEHYLWWVMSQHLFLAERAVQGALLNAFGESDRRVEFSRAILSGYAESYERYPNSDNVLGPTRLFFSTYLESIWLLQICVALDLLELTNESGSLSQLVRDKIIAPSSRIIAMYDEGGSNRQAWNSAALVAASRMLGAESEYEQHAARAVALMRQSLLADGSWYEGENYHLFAHRALWYLVNHFSVAGRELPPELLLRYRWGFVAPFRSALPDMTLLARRDSPYAISLRQWRFAELCELGIADSADSDHRLQLSSFVGELYSGELEQRETGRSRSTAEVERNYPASALSRSDLGWKSLLFAEGDAVNAVVPRKDTAARPRAGYHVLAPQWVPAFAGTTMRSTLLDAQGLAVFRRGRDQAMVALDYGHHGGGHGHPDRLNINLSTGSSRWLDDMGTGSYVDASLFWYRSGLAHNAPFANWETQTMQHGALQHFEDDGTAGYAQASFYDERQGLVFSREVSVLDGYCVDVLTWTGEAASVQLPLHLPFHEISIRRGGGSEADFQPLSFSENEDEWRSINKPGVDAGVGYISTPRSSPLEPGSLLRIASSSGEGKLKSWVFVEGAVRIWKLNGPSAPGTVPARAMFFVLDFEPSSEGGCAIVHSWAADSGFSVMANDLTEITVKSAGYVEKHQLSADGWTYQHPLPPQRLKRFPRQSVAAIYHSAMNQKTKVERRTPTHRQHPGVYTIPQQSEPIVAFSHIAEKSPNALRFELAEPHFRKSELDWSAHGCPRATTYISSDAESLAVAVTCTPRRPLRRAETAPYLDNENPDINSNGIQIHIASDAIQENSAEAQYLLVPEESIGGAVRVTTSSPRWEKRSRVASGKRCRTVTQSKRV